MHPTPLPTLTLALADGRRWLIRPGDDQAATVVAALGAAMRLPPGDAGRELVAVVGQDSRAPLPDPRGSAPLVCPLLPIIEGDMLTIQVDRLALLIARDAQQRGGVLLHGALAEYCPHPTAGAEGVILAGPGTVGKSTACRRLSPPWRSLCDDAALVVRDAQGRYWAHPWPTWSCFYSLDGAPGPGGSWEVQRAVPLRAIFFLSQAPDDRVAPVNRAQAVAMLMESARQATSPLTRRMDESAMQAVYREQMGAVNDLVRAVPVSMLHLSLHGAFWQEIERILAEIGDAPPNGVADAGSGRPLSVEEVIGDGRLRVAYTGPSMNPTLREPDLLEAQPYGDHQPVRVGDVIHFLSPTSGRWVVHRVVGVTPAGIRTRGDNNRGDDPDLLLRSAISGRVVVAQRGRHRRSIAGSWRGRLVGRSASLYRLGRRWPARLLHGAYHALARSGLLRRLLPPGLRPRVASFRCRQQTLLKLMLGGHVIGQYDNREKRWRIQPPFRLFVDEAALLATREAEAVALH